MIYMLDTANVEEIKKAINLYPIQAVTTNPSIIAKENKDFFEILKEIREVVGNDVTIHAQVIGKTAEEMISEAREIRKSVAGSLYIKIPATTQGIKAIRILSAENFNLTATAIITPQQALMAATAGAEFLAPYINRIDNICGDGVKVVEDIIRLLEVTGNEKAKVVGASFKSVNQVHQTILAGAKAITVNLDILEKLVYHPLTEISIENFILDWEKAYNK